MAVEKQLHTIEDFKQFVSEPENSDRLFELINGEIIEVMPGRTSNSQIPMVIAAEVRPFCKTHDIACSTSGADGAYRIGNDVLVPDFAYKRTPMSDDYPDPVAPLWAVEVISPTDEIGKIRSKRALYLAAGILLWEIYPQDRSVEVYAPGKTVQTFSIDDTLDVGDLLPGFTLAVSALFAGD